MKAIFQAQTQYGYYLGYPRPELFASCVLLLCTLPFVTAIHELGYLVVGWACRQKCIRFAMGPLELSPVARGWKLRWTPVWRAGAAGLVPSTFDGFRLQRALCSAGGPFASALVAPWFLYLAMHAPSHLSYWTWSFCLQWALVGVSALAPMRFGAARSDGLNLWEALAAGQSLDWAERDLLTPVSHATPLRVADWPHDVLLRIAGAKVDPVNQKFNQYLNYIHFLDRGDVESAGPYLDRLSAAEAPDDPPEYALEAAYFHGVHRNDAAKARYWLEIEKGDAEPWVRLRARAAVARAAGDGEEAGNRIAEALALLRAEPPCGAYQYEIDRLIEMQ